MSHERAEASSLFRWAAIYARTPTHARCDGYWLISKALIITSVPRARRDLRPTMCREDFQTLLIHVIAWLTRAVNVAIVRIIYSDVCIMELSRLTNRLNDHADRFIKRKNRKGDYFHLEERCLLRGKKILLSWVILNRSVFWNFWRNIGDFSH